MKPTATITVVLLVVTAFLAALAAARWFCRLADDGALVSRDIRQSWQLRMATWGIAAAALGVAAWRLA